MVTDYQDDVDPEDMQIFNPPVFPLNDQDIILNVIKNEIKIWFTHHEFFIYTKSVVRTCQER